MSATWYHEVEAVKVLVPNGGWKFNPANQNDSGLGNGHAGVHLHHFYCDHGISSQ
jgi:hypothetical protein